MTFPLEKLCLAYVLWVSENSLCPDLGLFSPCVPGRVHPIGAIALACSSSAGCSACIRHRKVLPGRASGVLLPEAAREALWHGLVCLLRVVFFLSVHIQVCCAVGTVLSLAMPLRSLPRLKGCFSLQASWAQWGKRPARIPAQTPDFRRTERGLQNPLSSP